MSETKLRIIKVGSYSQSKSADPQDCKVCHDAKWGTVIIEGVCAECLLAELSKYKWIPVSEKPESSKRVWVHMGNDYEVCATYIEKLGIWKNDGGSEVFNVTHWLPLPPPPEREK